MDVFVSIDMVDAPGSEVVANYALAEGYLKALQDLSEKYGLKNDVSVMALARYPDILTVRKAPEDEDAIWNAVRQVADRALDAFIAMREKEGVRMKEDVLSRAAAILQAVGQVEERSPQTVREHMDKVQARMRELLDGACRPAQRAYGRGAWFADAAPGGSPAEDAAGTGTRRSKRPGRVRAGSRESGRLVAARMMTPVLPSKPSISVRSWFKVCSRSSFPPI